jgi:hypothetical protein
MRSVFAGLVAALVWLSPPARSQHIEAIEIVEAGIYSGRHQGKQASPKTASGTINIVSDRQLLEATAHVCARIGVYFGVTYVLKGAPKGVELALDLVTRFPEAGMVNAKGERFTHNQFISGATIGERNVRTFSFDEPWELVPGTWTFEFHHKGRKIGETSFLVMTTCEVS